MTGKLLKYEFRSAFRQLRVVWAALIAMSILLGLNIRFSNFTEKSYEGFTAVVVEFIPIMLFVAIYMASVVLTIVIVVMRFYKGLLGDEGYLMHTLPVSTGKLIVSKGVAATVVTLISSFLSIFSIALLALVGTLTDITSAFDAVKTILHEYPEAIGIGIQFLIAILVEIISSIYIVYASLAIGQLSEKHRILISTGAFIGINTIIGAIEMIVAGHRFLLQTGITEVGNQLPSEISYIIITSIFLGLAQTVVFHIITERLLSKKLNLL